MSLARMRNRLAAWDGGGFGFERLEGRRLLSITLPFQDGILPDSAYAGTRDTRINSLDPIANYGSTKTLRLDGSPDGAALLKWDLSGVAPGSTVEAVSLSVHVDNASGDTFEIYKLKRDWVEAGATWNESSPGIGWEIPGVNGASDRGSTVLGTLDASATGPATVLFNVAGVAVVQAWIDNPASNFGIILQNYETATDRLDLDSRNVAAAANRPRLDVTIAGEAVNREPVVDEGVDQSVLISQTVTLNGSVVDDGLPDPPGAVTTTWTQVFGPGTAVFGDASAIDTTVTFTALGTYVLRLQADDGEFIVSDDVIINVLPLPQNNSPEVDAGPDVHAAIFASVALDGTVTDDGLPNPPAVVTTAWTQLSGPGAATFADASAVDTTAAFDAPGTYVLRLQADDGELAGVDDLTVVVDDPAWTTHAFQDGTLPEAAYAGTRDARINSQDPTANYGATGILRIDGTPDAAALLRWDLGSIASGGTIEAVAMSVHVDNPSIDGFEIYELKRDWVEREVSWNESSLGNSWQLAGALGEGDRGSTVLGTLEASEIGPATIQFNSAGVAVVQSWIDDPALNFGIIIQDYENAIDRADLSSREVTTAANRPKLEVTVAADEIPENDPPTANDDAAETDQDTPIVIDVLANDTDVDGSIDPATVALVDPPANGTVTIGFDGAITYAPAAGFSGTDNFTYHVRDDAGNVSNAATVTLLIEAVTAGPISTPGLYAPSAAGFHLRATNDAGNSTLAATPFSFGPANAGWQSLVGDFDSDAVDTIGLYDPSGAGFYLKNVNANPPSDPGADVAFTFGPRGDRGWQPLVGDWDGDGVDTVGLYDPAVGGFHLRASSDPNDSALAVSAFTFGPRNNAGWIAIAGDWDGDGVDTVGLYDPTTAGFHLRATNDLGNKSLAATPFRFGPANAGWQPLVGDWDGDGGDTVGLYDPAAAGFHLRASNDPTPALAVPAFSFGPRGNQGWIAMAGAFADSRSPLRETGPQLSSSATAPLAETELQATIAEAFSRWDSGTLANDLPAIDFVVADLPDSLLGLVRRDTIYLDSDAAGHGWFVDHTPGSDEEFRPIDGQLKAVDPRAVDRVDLLTVVSHELGHIFGLQDLDVSDQSLMSGTLQAGLRRQPGAAEIDQYLAFRTGPS